MSRLGTETAFEVLNAAKALERQGKSIVHLEIGEPDFSTPANIVEAAATALRAGWTHYGPSAVLTECAEVDGLPVITAAIGVKDRFGESGAPWELVKEFEVSAEHIALKAAQLAAHKKEPAGIGAQSTSLK